ncbi:hypothetical protein AB3480_34815 [Rhizobium mongolense]|uniref:hypothetical protein n=1 Tax=Rhizobium mongolense TaxID=57676 RepID=UPI0034A4A322
MEYASGGLHYAKGRLMARSMHIYTIEDVAAMTGETLELLREISANSDNIDYGKMMHVSDSHRPQQLWRSQLSMPASLRISRALVMK